MNNSISKTTKFKRITSDFMYSIASSFIYTGIIQIIVYPLLARMMGVGQYGYILTAMGVINTVSMSLGNTLNNTRLIQNYKYQESHLEGDFNILLIFANIIGFIIIMFFGDQFLKLDIIGIILIGILVVINIIKSYFSVSFRLSLKFKVNLFLNLITGIGYILGLFLFKYINYWQIIFIIAELIGVGFLVFTTHMHKEKIKTTPLFRNTSKKYILLIITGLISSLLVYLDRLMIFPILGAEAVSIYTVASFFGKSLGLVMAPMASVLLGYYAQQSFKITLKRFWYINFFVLLVTFIFFLISLVISPSITSLLYPSIISLAKPYIIIANLASLINVANMLIDPIVLRYAPTFWQVIIYIMYGCTYIGLGFLLIIKYNIIGLCYASIFANSFKLVSLILVGSYYTKKLEKGIK